MASKGPELSIWYTMDMTGSHCVDGIPRSVSGSVALCAQCATSRMRWQHVVFQALMQQYRYVV